MEYILDLLYSCVFSLDYEKNLERKRNFKKIKAAVNIQSDFTAAHQYLQLRMNINFQDIHLRYQQLPVQTEYLF